MESIQRIQNIVDKNKESLSSDDYNTICMQMKEIFKKKDKEPTDYVKITYIDYPLVPTRSGVEYDYDYENENENENENDNPLIKRLYINSDIKNTVIKIDKCQLEHYEKHYNNKGYLKLQCNELNWECDCNRSHRQEYLEEILNLSFQIDTHIVIKFEKIN